LARSRRGSSKKKKLIGSGRLQHGGGLHCDNRVKATTVARVIADEKTQLACSNYMEVHQFLYSLVICFFSQPYPTRVCKILFSFASDGHLSAKYSNLSL
jgi:hypothetical protein